MKKFICSVLTVILVLSLFVPASFASQDDYSKIVKEVEKTNEKIERFINHAIRNADKEIEKYNMEIEAIEGLRDNENIDVDKLLYEAEQKLERKVNRIIDHLVDDTNRAANLMIEKAAKAGIEVICEYVEVEIGGQIVLVDPLRVVGF